ncbi:hypothetical protein EVAR_96867_1 [Eumeta japonica]|uniref:Uncharacterized protein n=1 Tax=Eumeta variegata TaxID=151549 RepID=A0A4C1WLU9_EUMVA|nr:hypothetical protein EVAR_96867_1 [Eumeta japonica]
MKCAERQVCNIIFSRSILTVSITGSCSFVRLITRHRDPLLAGVAPIVACSSLCVRAWRSRCALAVSRSSIPRSSPLSFRSFATRFGLRAVRSSRHDVLRGCAAEAPSYDREQSRPTRWITLGFNPLSSRSSVTSLSLGILRCTVRLRRIAKDAESCLDSSHQGI